MVYHCPLQVLFLGLTSCCSCSAQRSLLPEKCHCSGALPIGLHKDLNLTLQTCRIGFHPLRSLAIQEECLRLTGLVGVGLWHVQCSLGYVKTTQSCASHNNHGHRLSWSGSIHKLSLCLSPKQRCNPSRPSWWAFQDFTRRPCEGKTNGHCLFMVCSAGLSTLVSTCQTSPSMGIATKLSHNGEHS